MLDDAADGPVTVTINSNTLRKITLDSWNMIMLDFLLLSTPFMVDEVYISSKAKQKPTMHVTKANLEDKYPCRSTSTDLFSIQLIARHAITVTSSTALVRPNSVVLL